MQRFQFHPVVTQWFEQQFGTPTDPQERGWPAIQSGSHTLVAAPTGSGKTLAAFLAALDGLFREGLAGTLPDETRVLYVSPLKALSNDIHKNLEEPLAGIRAAMRAATGKDVDVRADVRTGDTPAARRRAITVRPPHILVTTPESFYLLLTSASGRRLLEPVRTLIVDEIHAVAGNRRGSHLALSMERLAALARQPLQRIGLSATQKPIEEIARFLVGTRSLNEEAQARCAIIDSGHRRNLDLAIELPGSPLEAVMSNEVWAEVYGRLAELIEGHRTTLVFVNTRRLAERVTHQLAERLGQDKVTSHHGSLSATLRHDAEQRLKRGELRALVATASLELGIDIGSVDLVCQIGPTRSIATLLQRVGRAEHRRGGLPKGRLFPLSRDELVETVATVRSLQRGELDRLEMPAQPLDILAQQIVACAACEDWEEQKLFDLMRSAYPYRNLARTEFDDVLRMLAEGFSTRRGRRAALVHHDAVNQRVRGRRGVRLIALTSGGAIPDNADYRVVLEPTETFIGTVNEDFAIESMAGDIFQLGNASWRILRVNSGMVRVEDAQGQPPSIPFWLGEAPGRTAELSAAVSQLRMDIEDKLVASPDLTQPGPNPPAEAEPRMDAHGGESQAGGDSNNTLALLARASANEKDMPPPTSIRVHSRSFAVEAPHAGREASLADWLQSETGLSERGAHQIADYFGDVHRALGVVPSQHKLVLERFFDESGGMQLVLHAPFGIRVNRAWGLALRKRFCRSFNFELQAAATDDAIVLSLGTQHSFPLDEVFRYLHSNSVRDLLVQALLDAPMFPIRWRWNASRALALPRQRGGRKVPPPLQRMEAENLLAAVFPDQLACLEHIVGDREIPDHPLVRQTIDDCLDEAMDIQGLIAVLKRIEDGSVQCIARDLPEPSPLAHEILNAKPYAFLDNAPLEERRTQAVYTRRASESSADAGLGVLDAAAIERVCAEAWPRAVNPDELQEALQLAVALTEEETRRVTEQAPVWLEALAQERRAGRVGAATGFWFAAERLPVVEAVYPGRRVDPSLVAPRPKDASPWERADAVRELIRGRIEIAGPLTADFLTQLFQLPRTEVDAALLALEAEGFVLRGKFHPGVQELEWCDRRLLARIHRLTIHRLRAEIQPVCVADFQRFLLAWQRIDRAHQAEGPEGVRAILDLLDGLELPAAAWEPDVLAQRVKDYTPEWLDQHCFTGRVGWGRLTCPPYPKSRPFPPLRSSPVALFAREHLPHWLALAGASGPVDYSPDTRQVLDTLSRGGALFFTELVRLTRLLPSRVEQALAELTAQGCATADAFEGLRALLVPQEKRASFGQLGSSRRHRPVTSVELAGRWSLLRLPAPSGDTLAMPGTEPDLGGPAHEAAMEEFARTLLRRYGVMFRRLLERESLRAGWFELSRVYRRIEARGEIRGGHFVSGVSGEQFALPEAIGLLRSLRKAGETGECVVISAADPLNLAGILTPGPRVTAISSNRVLLKDGVPIAALQAGEVILLDPEGGKSAQEINRALRIGTLPVALRPYYA